MKILKHGKVMLVKLDCPYCGCEFTCDPLTEIKAEQVIEYKADCGFLYTEEYVGCPCCGKRFRGDFDELPEYKGELTQSDLERMASLVYDSPQARADSWSEAAKMIAQYLIDHGVTFTESAHE